MSKTPTLKNLLQNETFLQLAAEWNGAPDGLSRMMEVPPNALATGYACLDEFVDLFGLASRAALVLCLVDDRTIGAVAKRIELRQSGSRMDEGRNFYETMTPPGALDDNP